MVGANTLNILDAILCTLNTFLDGLYMLRIFNYQFIFTYQVLCEAKNVFVL